MHREVGGKPLDDEELRELVSDAVPWIIEKELINKKLELKNWPDTKGWITEYARILHIEAPARAVNVVEAEEVSETFWLTTDELEFEDAVAALRDYGTDDNIML